VTFLNDDIFNTHTQIQLSIIHVYVYDDVFQK